MESSEVSRHQILVFRFLQQATVWVTAKDVAKATKVASRTARHHLLLLTKMGLVDVAEVFPGHRYRFSEKAGKRNAAYLQRLEYSAKVFEL
jgi:DNA-binding transcriptional ArsR family regulator